MNTPTQGASTGRTRKTNLSVTYPIRFTQAQYDWLKANGGSKLVRSLVIAEMNTANKGGEL